ncbi:SDR family NAD(P)-dependent oxidoreductase [Pseudonocardia tropica]|uniref:SDR family NAD(P)-dependent oxidoreductase n=1 Tax=Pseudonocardia tropica TaxID=681289 RepID=A0ABV1JYJ4_9PSEU
MSTRVWLITGASAGLGRSLARAALDAGDSVVAAVRRPDSVGDLVAAAPDRVATVELDVTDTARIAPAAAEALSRFGRIDVLVNNAGRGMAGAAEETSDEDLRELMELHFFGPVTLTRTLLGHMRERGSGAIVQMSSQAGRYSFPGISSYSATKFALEGWSESLSAEVEQFGIDVMIVEPGPFRTSFNEPDVFGFPAASETYQAVEPVRTALAKANGEQAGDPDRAAAAILTALGSGTPPLRLPLGNEAADSILASFERSSDEIATWEELSRSADYAV